MSTPTEIAARFAEGVQARARWDSDTAEQIFRALCAFDFARPRALTELAVTLSLQGRGAEALQTIEQAVVLAPMDATIRQNALILEKLREPEDPARFVALHRQWGADFAPGGGSMYAWTLRAAHAQRRLRVAYLGVDAHAALERFMPPLALQHDASQFDVFFVYRSNTPVQVAASMAALPMVRHLHASGIDARQLAHRLAMLQIDIAIDLCGHGIGHVLDALAYRPAPVQLSWLDYVATTGVAAIDGRIADAITDPAEASWPEVASERTLRLPFAQWCCTPFVLHERAPRNCAGAVFGLINALNKISPALLERATRLLHQVPQSTLRVFGFSGEQARRNLLGRLEKSLHARVEFIARVDEAEFHRLLGAVDVALDPLVFSGATSTLDCLWAGIPVVTEPGVLPHTRSSASILHSLGLQAWIARDADDFVCIAATLAADSVLRDRLRTELPERLRQSSLSDGSRFVPALEQLYRDAWRDHGVNAEPLAAIALGSDAGALKRTLIERANETLLRSQTQLGDPQQAIYAFETLALAMPSAAVQRNLSRAWNNLGVIRRKRDQPAEARANFRTALEIWSDNPEARDNLGAE